MSGREVVLLNGSPKRGEGSSVLLLRMLAQEMGGEGRILSGRDRPVPTAASALVISAPLYVDGLPSHLLEYLIEAAEAHCFPARMPVYGIINCGFYEGRQTEPAFLILRNWCARADLRFCGGIGVGGSGMLSIRRAVSQGWPRRAICRELAALAKRVKYGADGEILYLNPSVPRSVYRFGAEISWRCQIRAAGLAARELNSRPQPDHAGRMV